MIYLIFLMAYGRAMDGVTELQTTGESPTHLIRIAHSDEILRCASGRSLLSALNSIAPKVAVGCRGGGCGVCRVRVLGGEASFGRMSARHVSQPEREAGWTLACRTYPTSDMLIAMDNRRRII